MVANVPSSFIDTKENSYCFGGFFFVLSHKNIVKRDPNISPSNATSIFNESAYKCSYALSNTNTVTGYSWNGNKSDLKFAVKVKANIKLEGWEKMIGAGYWKAAVTAFGMGL